MVFLGTLAAMLLDPIVLIFCWIAGAMIGPYRVAVPACIFISCGIFIGGSSFNLTMATIFMFALVGAIHGALSVAAWRLVPDKFKRFMTE